MMYYNVTFEKAEGVFCVNIAHAESVEAIKAHYSGRSLVDVSEASADEVAEAKRKGMPIVEVEVRHMKRKIRSIDEIAAELNAHNDRSAWGRGVTAYARELLGEYAEFAAYEKRDAVSRAEFTEWILNGAADWSQYSYGGCSLIYGCDIAERLCSPSELRRKRGGDLQPNSRETWLDVQARALRQAAGRLSKIAFTEV